MKKPSGCAIVRMREWECESDREAILDLGKEWLGPKSSSSFTFSVETHGFANYFREVTVNASNAREQDTREELWAILFFSCSKTTKLISIPPPAARGKRQKTKTRFAFRGGSRGKGGTTVVVQPLQQTKKTCAFASLEGTWELAWSCYVRFRVKTPRPHHVTYLVLLPSF